MAVLTYQASKTLGMTVTMAAADPAGDTVRPRRRGAVLVRNADAAAKTVTVEVPGTQYGQARPDYTVAVAAGAIAMIGPFPDDLGDPVTGLVKLTYSATTSVTVAAITT